MSNAVTNRRRFLGSAAAFLSAAELVNTASAKTNSSFASVKQIDAGLLNVGYADIGPANGPAVVLLQQKLFTAPEITVSSITVASDFDGSAADGAAYRRKFTGRYDHRILKGIGHNVPQEAPQAFAQAVIDAGRL